MAVVKPTRTSSFFAVLLITVTCFIPWCGCMTHHAPSARSFPINKAKTLVGARCVSNTRKCNTYVLTLLSVLLLGAHSYNDVHLNYDPCPTGVDRIVFCGPTPHLLVRLGSQMLTRARNQGRPFVLNPLRALTRWAKLTYGRHHLQTLISPACRDTHSKSFCLIPHCKR